MQPPPRSEGLNADASAYHPPPPAPALDSSSTVHGGIKAPRQSSRNVIKSDGASHASAKDATTGEFALLRALNKSNSRDVGGKVVLDLFDDGVDDDVVTADVLEQKRSSVAGGGRLRSGAGEDGVAGRARYRSGLQQTLEIFETATEQLGSVASKGAADDDLLAMMDAACLDP